jgi:UDP-glucose 4-epimerase
VALILVTGGAGFIGSHVAAALLANGHDVRVVDNFSTGIAENLPVDADFIDGDLTDVSVAAAAVRGCELVLHQAAVPSVPRSISHPRPSHESNIDATFNVLTAARDAGVRRVVYAASSSAYGDSAMLPKVEDMPVNPRSGTANETLSSTRKPSKLLFTPLAESSSLIAALPSSPAGDRW